MQEDSDRAPTPPNPFLEWVRVVPAQMSTAGDGIRAQDAGKGFAATSWVLSPSRTAVVEEQGCLDALGLLSTHNGKEPAEQKHAS